MPPWVPMGPTEEQMSSAPLKLILTSLSRASVSLVLMNPLSLPYC